MYDMRINIIVVSGCSIRVTMNLRHDWWIRYDMISNVYCLWRVVCVTRIITPSYTKVASKCITIQIIHFVSVFFSNTLFIMLVPFTTINSYCCCWPGTFFFTILLLHAGCAVLGVTNRNIIRRNQKQQADSSNLVAISSLRIMASARFLIVVVLFCCSSVLVCLDANIQVSTRTYILVLGGLVCTTKYY